MTAFMMTLGTPLLTGLWFGLLPLLAVAAAVTLPVLAVPHLRPHAGPAFVFALTGGGIGLLIGSSRDPAMGAVLPAVVALIGGIAAFTLPREQTARLFWSGPATDAPPPAYLRAAVMTAVAALMAAAVFGASTGAALREAGMAREEARARDRLIFEAIELPVERDQIRRALDLPPTPPP